jgi:L-ascorbate metabolism protein UlaG (beta-lactamase superfamily)
MTILKIVLIILGIAILALAAFYFFAVRVPMGKEPSSARRLERMRRSPQFRDGVFHNRRHTPQLTGGGTMAGVMFDFLFGGSDAKRPTDSIPSVHTDLAALPADGDAMVWFGHSSYLLQLGGVRFLVDPVFSKNASPVPGSNTPFAGADTYTAADMPEVDYLVITHDHYDHLDYETVTALRHKVKVVLCPLGVGEHLEYWGYPEGIITELDWGEHVELSGGITATATPARHFSGRSFKRNTTLWMSMVLRSPRRSVYVGGDSGYDTHFAAIGAQHGPFDVAILENGQYDERWKFIHALPDEVVQAGIDLQARRVVPVHSGKFALALHSWTEPLDSIAAIARVRKLPLATPMIGEVMFFDAPAGTFREWWRGLR